MGQKVGTTGHDLLGRGPTPVPGHLLGAVRDSCHLYPGANTRAVVPYNLFVEPTIEVMSNRVPAAARPGRAVHR
jgi:hypothetical protein